MLALLIYCSRLVFFYYYFDVGVLNSAFGNNFVVNIVVPTLQSWLTSAVARWFAPWALLRGRSNLEIKLVFFFSFNVLGNGVYVAVTYSTSTVNLLVKTYCYLALDIPPLALSSVAYATPFPWMDSNILPDENSI